MENYFQMNFDRQQLLSMSTLGLAHIGDGVFDLLCRAYLCSKGDQTVLKLHRDTVGLVKAPTQAKFADKLLPLLTEEEFGYYRRGKNAHTHAAGVCQSHRLGSPLRRAVPAGQDRPDQRIIPYYNE